MAEGYQNYIRGINQQAISIQSGDDLNNYYGISKAGFYYITTGMANISNCPAGYSMLLVISAFNNETGQLLFNNDVIFFRRSNGGSSSWGNWHQISLSS